LTQAYHALGDHKQELAASREARTRYPDRIDMFVLRGFLRWPPTDKSAL
jgi:hypothetical protein